MIAGTAKRAPFGGTAASNDALAPRHVSILMRTGEQAHLRVSSKTNGRSGIFRTELMNEDAVIARGHTFSSQSASCATGAEN